MTRMQEAAQVIAQSGLPAELQALVTKVVRRTRLRCDERAEVARELTSQLAWAMAEGRSPDEAGAALGDPRRAARNLRAAAIAKRPMVDRALCWTWAWGWRALGAMALAYACCGVYLWTSTPRVTFDPIERMQARLPAARGPEGRAWTRYRDALLLSGCGADDPRSAERLGTGADLEAMLPGELGWPEIAAWTDSQQPAIAMMRKASQLPVLGYPLGEPMSDEDAVLFGQEAQAQSRRSLIEHGSDSTRLRLLSLDYLASLRLIGRLLAADAMRGIQREDGARATDDILAMIALSRHAQEGRDITDDFTAISLRAFACIQLTAILEWKPACLTDAQLVSLQQAMTSVPPDLERLDMSMESIIFDDCLQHMYTDDGSGDGWFRANAEQLEELGWVDTERVRSAAQLRLEAIAVVIGGPLSAAQAAGRRAAREFWQDFAHRAELESAKELRDQANACLKCELNRLEQVPESAIHWRLPLTRLPFDLDFVVIQYAQDRARRAAAATAVAAERFRRATGRWPTSAEELAPRFLPSVPMDPWDGQPIRMASDGPGYRIWSVGRDGTDERGDLSKAIGKGAGGDASANLVGSHLKDPRGLVDWVWFAPRGDLVRWVQPAEAPGGTTDPSTEE